MFFSSLNKLAGYTALLSNLTRLVLWSKIHIELTRSILNHCEISILSPISLANKHHRMHISLFAVKLVFNNLATVEEIFRMSIYRKQLHRILPESKKSHHITGWTAEASCNLI